MAGSRAETPGFLVVGHAVQDLLTDDPAGPWRLGGAVSYASLLARKFGLRAAVLTSAGPDFDVDTLLPGIECSVVPAAHSTQIQNVYESGRRRQRMPQRAARLTHQHLPDAWRATPLVLLGPVAGELDDSLAAVFSGSVFGVGAQGWLRETAPDDTVQPVHPDDWADEAVLKGATALFLSDEDVPPDDAAPALKRWCGMVDIVAFTRGYDGADVCYDGEWRHIDAFPANAVDPTGAGDVFAAAFLIRLGETKDPWESARFASCAASFVVAGEGVAAIPGRQQVEELLAQQPEPQ